jgi:hypothetical protein
VSTGRSGPGFRTPHSIELSRITDQLAALQDLQVGESDWCDGIVTAYLSTAHIWPLEVAWHEILLGFAGLDLANAADLSDAVSISQVLLGTGFCDLVCADANDPSPLWERLQAGEDEDLREAGAQIVNTDLAVWLLRLRRRRAAQAIRRCRAA